uniref:DUF569 domain-containing protein n=1 Tax=Aegilops tauschii subsp. strangulata TaxID=200361 RepID=A0A453QRA3_AEGTS
VSTNSFHFPSSPRRRSAKKPRTHPPRRPPLHRAEPPPLLSMDQFHHGHHVRLRSRQLGTYLCADEDGHGVSLHPHRASMNT